MWGAAETWLNLVQITLDLEFVQYVILRAGMSSNCTFCKNLGRFQLADQDQDGAVVEGNLPLLFCLKRYVLCLEYVAMTYAVDMFCCCFCWTASVPFRPTVLYSEKQSVECATLCLWWFQLCRLDDRLFRFPETNYGTLSLEISMYKTDIYDIYVYGNIYPCLCHDWCLFCIGIFVTCKVSFRCSPGEVSSCPFCPRMREGGSETEAMRLSLPNDAFEIE